MRAAWTTTFDEALLVTASPKQRREACARRHGQGRKPHSEFSEALDDANLHAPPVQSFIIPAHPEPLEKAEMAAL
jgi:hypothetical protein